MYVHFLSTITLANVIPTGIHRSDPSPLLSMEPRKADGNILGEPGKGTRRRRTRNRQVARDRDQIPAFAHQIPLRRGEQETIRMSHLLHRL